MNAIMCELCGSNDVVKQGGYFVCQHCGTKYTPEDAKKLIGTVKIDNTDYVQRYLQNARRAKQKADWEEVEKYYNLVEQNEPSNIEAIFYSAYGKAGWNIRPLLYQLCMSLYRLLYPLRLDTNIPLRCRAVIAAGPARATEIPASQGSLAQASLSCPFGAIHLFPRSTRAMKRRFIRIRRGEYADHRQYRRVDEGIDPYGADFSLYALILPILLS